MTKPYVAHCREDEADQPLEAHLREVAELAGEFARAFDAEQVAYRAGLLHDIGKYSPAGQRRMRDVAHTAKVDHATAGAVEACRASDAPAMFVIAGHHGGLSDFGDLKIRLEKDLSGELDYAAFRSEVNVPTDAPLPVWLKPSDRFAVQFFTRMLFSCLVDADFLDTERFMQNGAVERGGGDSMARLLERLEKHIAEKFTPKPGEAVSAINERRARILRRCLEVGSEIGGSKLYTLTVPTGGGKTISSLAFALCHAIANGKRRVIYVVPYTSIIDQNAAIYAEILGEENVLTHHANANVQDDDERDSEEPTAMRKRLAAENWDAPVVVTTAVQFFESLYASRVSRCRKLHNIANSVVIFDEAQMMPLPYLRPCVAAITELVRHYGVTAVLCTATQPALGGVIREFAPELRAREIMEEPDELYAFFRRVRYQMEGELTLEELARRLSEQTQTLCVVNSRKLAVALFEALPKEGRFHLSTWMTPDDRKRVIDVIRGRLDPRAAERLPCRVVSTSLIEAGVDVDFPSVWREETGLDSVCQAAGRCNREGRQGREESVVHVFRVEGQKNRWFAQQTDCMRIAVDKGDEMDAPATIRRYFEHLIRLRGKDALDNRRILNRCTEWYFKTVANDFRIIDDETVSVYIPTEANAGLLRALRYGGLSRGLLRKLAGSAVSVYRSVIPTLLSAGKLEVTPEGHYILADAALYTKETGLKLTGLAGVAGDFSFE